MLIALVSVWFTITMKGAMDSIYICEIIILAEILFCNRDALISASQ